MDREGNSHARSRDVYGLAFIRDVGIGDFCCPNLKGNSRAFVHPSFHISYPPRVVAVSTRDSREKSSMNLRPLGSQVPPIGRICRAIFSICLTIGMRSSSATPFLLASAIRTY